MLIITWVVMGLVAGFIANKLLNKSGEKPYLNIGLGILGALVSGGLINKVGMVGVTGLNFWSVLVSVGGAVVVLVIYQGFRATPMKGLI